MLNRSSDPPSADTIEASFDAVMVLDSANGNVPMRSSVYWTRAGAKPRVRIAPYSYLDRELVTTAEVDRAVAAMEKRPAEEPQPERRPGSDVADAMAREKNKANS